MLNLLTSVLFASLRFCSGVWYTSMLGRGETPPYPRANEKNFFSESPCFCDLYRRHHRLKDGRLGTMSNLHFSYPSSLTSSARFDDRRTSVKAHLTDEWQEQWSSHGVRIMRYPICFGNWPRIGLLTSGSTWRQHHPCSRIDHFSSPSRLPSIPLCSCDWPCHIGDVWILLPLYVHQWLLWLMERL